MSRTYRAATTLLVLLAVMASACATETELVGSGDGPASSATETPAEEPTAAEANPAPTEPAAEPTEPAAEPTEAPAEPTAEPEPEPTAPAEDATEEPTPEIVSVDDLDELGARIFNKTAFGDELSGDELACAVSELSESGNAELLARANEVEFEELSEDHQADLAIIAFDCAPDAVAAAFSDAVNDADGVLPAEVGECLIDSMSSGAPDRRDVVLGFVALGEDRAAPVASQGPLVNVMVECLPGEVFSQAIAEAALADPDLAGAVDLACVANSLDGETLRPMWQAMVQNPSAEIDDLDPAAVEPLFTAIFGCISFGAILEAQTGATLSASSIACIDEAVADLDIAAMINTGEGAEQLGLAMLACLTPEELQQVGG